MTFPDEILAVSAMPYGEARTAAAESLVRRIEAEEERSVLPWALAELVDTYTFGGHGDRAFVAFARMLRLWDESAELFDEYDTRNLFWEYKWIADGVCEFPRVSRSQVDEFLDDMERRFRLQGLGLSAVMVSRFNWARSAGDPDAEERRRAWRATPSDEFDDCPACVVGSQVDFFLEQGRYEEALAMGATQQDSCNIEPTKTRHAMALAALLLGDATAALQHHRLALASFDGKARDLAPSRGQRFELLCRGGQLERALRGLRNDDAQLLDSASSPLNRLVFLLGVLAGLSASLTGEAGSTPTGLSGPTEPNGAVRGTVAELHAWVLNEASGLAAEFDARNGTGLYGTRVAAALRAELAPRRLDFGVQASESAAEAVPPMTAANDWPGTASESDSEMRVATAAGNGRQDPAQAFAEAETLAARHEYAGASVRYAEAAIGFEGEGLLGHAGLAHAEAAQCAAEAGDEERAHETFEIAVSRLFAGGVDPGPMLAVLAAWAPLAARMNDLREILQTLSDWIERLEAWRPSPQLSETVARKHTAEYAFALASARDLLARCLASSDDAQRPVAVAEADPVALAEAAAAAFDELHRQREAAHARWLAARLHRDAGETVASINAYELALDGFGRDAGARADAAGELIALFRACGLPEQSDRVVERLRL